MSEQNEIRQLVELLSGIVSIPVLATIAIAVTLGFACGIGVIRSIIQHHYFRMAAWILLPYSGMGAGAIAGPNFTGIYPIVPDEYLLLFVIVHSGFLTFPLGLHYFRSNLGLLHFQPRDRDEHDIDPRPFKRPTLHNQRHR